MSGNGGHGKNLERNSQLHSRRNNGLPTLVWKTAMDLLARNIHLVCCFSVAHKLARPIRPRRLENIPFIWQVREHLDVSSRPTCDFRNTGAAMTLGAAFATLTPSIGSLPPVARSRCVLAPPFSCGVAPPSLPTPRRKRELSHQDCMNRLTERTLAWARLHQKSHQQVHEHSIQKRWKNSHYGNKHRRYRSFRLHTRLFQDSTANIICMRFAQNQIQIPQTLNTDVALTWTTTPFAPATPIPNGKYALLGIILEQNWRRSTAYDSNTPTQPRPTSFSYSTIQSLRNPRDQEGMNDAVATDIGFQFCALSELLGKPSVPVFTVSNAATGLNIESVAAANTDTPVVTLNLAKVGQAHLSGQH